LRWIKISKEILIIEKITNEIAEICGKISAREHGIIEHLKDLETWKSESLEIESNQLKKLNKLLDKAKLNLSKLAKQYPERFKTLETEFMEYSKKCEEKNKDFLYKKLIDLEETRFSLENKLKELIEKLQEGVISDSEYNNQEKEIKNELIDKSSKITYLRAFIHKL